MRDALVLLVGLGFAGCIPACGYLGAKQRSKPLLGLFTCCNGCAMASFATMIVTLYLAMVFFNTKLDIGTGSSSAREHESLMEAINNAKPELKTCCKDLENSHFAVQFQGCPVAALDIDVYPVGSPLCPSEDDPSDGSSAASDVLCLDSQSCNAIEKIPDGALISNGMFYALIAIYIVACLPATIGCCSGCQLLKSPIMNGGPAFVGAAVNAPYGGRASATSYGK